MKKILNTLLAALLLSNPCFVLATDNFPVEIKKLQTIWGDTLSEIAESLLPQHKVLRKNFMKEVIALNPEMFPGEHADFMLADQILLFPSRIDGVNIKSLIKNRKKLSAYYLTPEELFTLNSPSKFEPVRFYSISSNGIETDINNDKKAQNQFRYITQGNTQGQIKIKNGALILLKANTKIKVYLNNNRCHINLFYGTLQIQDRNVFTRHCSINTKLVKITAINSDYSVQICNKNECKTNALSDNASTLPAGLYYGVLNGRIAITDKNRRYKANKGEFYYYALTAHRPAQIEPFNGLLFSKNEAVTSKGISKKSKFSWGYIKTNPK